ncbi:hypothetical protein RclHR1_00240002 [Rhizophagus clarus]|uniref:Uncharacterized protein n=1 Tax=Rhizophagus clarus TaxID=94130 RepID=A0A2Z6R9Z7_9GLOM|nr:hypothetical protein RclHR1_00240002 [Rhizophagus clarus]
MEANLEKYYLYRRNDNFTWYGSLPNITTKISNDIRWDFTVIGGNSIFYCRFTLFYVVFYVHHIYLVHT